MSIPACPSCTERAAARAAARQAARASAPARDSDDEDFSDDEDVDVIEGDDGLIWTVHMTHVASPRVLCHFHTELGGDCSYIAPGGGAVQTSVLTAWATCNHPKQVSDDPMLALKGTWCDQCKIYELDPDGNFPPNGCQCEVCLPTQQ